MTDLDRFRGVPGLSSAHGLRVPPDVGVETRLVVQVVEGEAITRFGVCARGESEVGPAPSN